MKKIELIAELQAKGLRVISVAEELDNVKNAAGVTQYIAHVMEQSGDRVQGRNIGFYVFDEGQPGEAAYYRDIVTPKNAARDLVATYMETLRPTTYLWYRINDVDEAQRVARVSVIDSADKMEKNIVVYKIGSNPITHAVLTTL